MIKVKNLNGTSDNKVPTGYTSWIDFWEEKSGKSATVCHKYACTNKTNLVGEDIRYM